LRCIVARARSTHASAVDEHVVPPVDQATPDMIQDADTDRDSCATPNITWSVS